MIIDMNFLLFMESFFFFEKILYVWWDFISYNIFVYMYDKVFIKFSIFDCGICVVVDLFVWLVI